MGHLLLLGPDSGQDCFIWRLQLLRTRASAHVGPRGSLEHHLTCRLPLSHSTLLRLSRRCRCCRFKESVNQKIRSRKTSIVGFEFKLDDIRDIEAVVTPMAIYL